MYTALLITNVSFCVAVFLAWWKPNVARFLFLILFFGAAVFNAANAIFHPESYWAFADFALFDFYRNFILGFFHDYTSVIVLLIAMAQALIAFGLAYGGVWSRRASWAGLLFGLVIAPLGVGSAFPASLLMSIAFWVLSNHPFEAIFNDSESHFPNVSHP